MSPEPFVSRAKALLAKRNEKGYGDENDTSLEGKNPKLQIAGDNVNLELCDSRDYFTST